jgi:hypothetical protein
MQNTRLIELLKTFKEKELLGLEDFISSKYFNKNTQIIELFTNIKKYFPAFDSEELTKQNLYLKIFGKKKYSDEAMRTLISGLMKLAKKYLIQLELEKRNPYANLFLLEQLRVRDQENLFEYEFDKADKYLKENLYREGDYYLARYLSHFMNFYAHPSGFNNAAQESELIYKIGASLERYFALEAMDVNYQMLTRKIKMNYRPKYIFLDNIKSKIESDEYNDTPLLPLKYYSFMAIENRENEEYFEKCQNLYFENFEKISDFERGAIHLAMVNYCMINISAGNEKYFEKSVVLYKFALENNLYFQNNKYLLPYMFHNIVKNALYVGDTKWVHKFIFEYKNKVPPEFRKEVVNVSFGKYYFETGDLDSALKHINKINPQNAQLKSEVLTLFIKIFYELSYVESVYSSIESLKRFVKTSNALAPSFVSTAQYFTKYMRKFMDLKEKFKKNEIEYLRKEISSIKDFGLINQRWILQKIDRAIKK